MKKSTLENVLAKKASPVLSVQPESPAPAKARGDDGKITTSLRIEANKLEALKILALRRRVRVNDLVVEGIDHVIALHKERAA